MSQDRIGIRDLASRLPALLRRFPKLVRGYYFYAQKRDRKPLTLGTLIEDNVRRYGQRPAIFYEDRVVTYAELNAWANRYARALQALGLNKGDRVALLIENRPELLALFIGAGKLGVACAFLNAAHKGRILEHSIKLTQPRLVVVGEELLGSFASVGAGLGLDHPKPFLFLADRDTRESVGDAPEGFFNIAALACEQSGEAPQVNDPPRMGDTAFFLFTSGTTGLPKAAPGSHRKFVKAYGGFGLMSLGMTTDDVMYVTLPFYHGTALLVCWGAAVAGGSVVVMRRRFSASHFWEDVRHYGVTTFGYVGELCRYLLNQPPSPADRDHKLRKMVGNGLRPSIWPTFKERFGIEQVVEFYASSEGNIGFSNILNLDNTVGMSTAPYALVRYHEGTRDPIRNAKGKLEEVKPGEPGLLLGEITRKWSFEGYTQKDATDQSIIRGAFRKKDAWFNTGDVMREIGFRHLQFVDRMGDTFRWKGENVSTTDVENIIDGFAGVEEAIVYGVEVPGTNGKAGMATLVVRSGAEGSCEAFDIDEFYRYLREQLPAYAVPVFVRITSAIEKTGTFKYLKSDFKDLGYQPGPPRDLVYGALSGGMGSGPKAPWIEGYRLLDSAQIAALDAGKIRL